MVETDHQAHMSVVETLGAGVYNDVQDMDTDEMPDEVSEKIHRAEALLQEAFDVYELKDHRGELE